MTWLNGLVRPLAATALLLSSQISSQAQSNDTLRVSISSTIQNLDPIRNSNILANALLKTTYETLTRIRRDSSVEPLLATEWTREADGKSWIVKLRQGVTFHDGARFDAAAVHANFLRVTDLKNPIASPATFDTVTGSEIIDDYTIRIRSAQPFSGLPIALSHGMAVMLSPKAIAEGVTRDRAAAGTGPFRIESFSLPDEIMMVRNDSYWGEKPKLKRIEFRSRSNDQTRLATLLSGEADVNLYVPSEGQRRVEADPDLRITKIDSIRAFIVHLPMGLPEMQDRRVRLALNLAIDRDQIVKMLFVGAAVPMDSSIGPGVFGYQASKPYPYDMAKATALLAEAGWVKDASGVLMRDGKPFPTIKFLSARGRVPNDARLAQTVAGYLTALGVSTTLQIDEFATFFAAALAGAKTGTSLVLASWGFAQMDGTSFLCSVYAAASYNMGNYKSDTVQKACGDISAAFDWKEREKLIADATEAAYQDLPAIFLVVPSYLVGTRKGVSGIVLDAGENHIFSGAVIQ